MRIKLAKVSRLRGEGFYLGVNFDFYWHPSDIWRKPMWTFLIDINLIKINICLELHGKYLQDK